MLLQFFKYQGTGNDFIMIDNRQGRFDHNRLDLVKKLCDRRFGIGADGLILIEDHDSSDFEMIYFNSDGSQSLCGNGSRCAVLFAQKLGLIKEKTQFIAIDGVHDASIHENIVSLKMNDVQSVEKIGRDFFVDTGSPHFIRLVDDVASIDVFAEGQAIRNSPRFKAEGTNVNFVQVLGENDCRVRTYERGVEDETLSCGTGVTAVALVLGSKGNSGPVRTSAVGGDLQVSFEKTDKNTFHNIHLIGPAKEVFSGKVDI